MEQTKTVISRENEKYNSKHNSPIIESKTHKSRFMAAFLAIIFGGAGIHKFYLGKAGWGLIYILFSWTFIPFIVGFIEGIIYLLMSTQEFEKKYS
jgi:TM2 domain-containing membrane protein YozV